MTVVPLARVDAYLDGAPRTSADAIEVGPFTLFRSTTISTYYARPRLGLAAPIAAADLLALRARCAELGLPFAVEGLLEMSPSLVEAARECGLIVELRPMLALRRADFRTRPPASEAVVRTLAAGDADIVGARAVAAVSFRAGGVGVGKEGERERDAAAALVPPERTALDRARAAAGHTVTVAAYLDAPGLDAPGLDAPGLVAAGYHQPVGDSTELCGVATLPAFRRRGIAADVVSALLADAFDRGVDVAMLSATDDDVARLYERASFARVGHAVEVSDEPS